MIYLLRRTKERKAEERHNLPFNEAKLFVESIRAQDFKVSDFLLLGADTPETLKSFMAQFQKNLFIKSAEEDEMFDFYIINPSVPKQERLVLNGAKTRAIMSFSEKIRKKISAENYELYFGYDHFNITFNKKGESIMITCSYELDILNSFAYDEDKKVKVEIDRARSYVVLANEVLRRQRSYYKKGKTK
jgi:hypothetical protein